MPPVSPNAEPTLGTPAPEVPLTITGKLEDAALMQAAAEVARNVSGIEPNPNSIVPGTEITVPDALKVAEEAPRPSETPAQIEVPAGLEVPQSSPPAPELPQQ